MLVCPLPRHGGSFGSTTRAVAQTPEPLTNEDLYLAAWILPKNLVFRWSKHINCPRFLTNRVPLVNRMPNRLPNRLPNRPSGSRESLSLRIFRPRAKQLTPRLSPGKGWKKIETPQKNIKIGRTSSAESISSQILLPGELKDRKNASTLQGSN